MRERKSEREEQKTSPMSTGYRGSQRQMEMEKMKKKNWG